jgi:tetratricopeptide (TPR) repeat protein
MRKIAIIIFLVSLCSSCQPAALAQNAGTTGFDFLKIGVMPRPISMGQSFVAVSNDIAACYWNPAGLGDISKRQLSFVASQWLLDMNYYYFSFISPTKSGALGLSVGMFSYGDIEGYDLDGGLTGNFTGYDGLVKVSWGRKISPGLLVGANLKYVTEQIDKNAGGYDESALTFDLGGLIKTKYEGLSLGANIQNIGTGLVRSSIPLPLNLKLGLAYQGKHNRNPFLLTSDVNMPSGQSPHFGIGFEYSLRDFLKLRTGIRFVSEGYGLITAGLGLHTNVFTLDFAYTPYRDFGNTFHVGITLGFPRSQVEKKADIAGMLKRGKDFYKSEEYAKALEEFNQVLRKDPNNEEALQNLKATMADIETKGKEASLAKEPQAEAYFNLGKSLFDQKNYEESIPNLEKALALLPNHKKSQEYLERSKFEVEKAKRLKIEEAKSKGLEYYRSGLEKFNTENYKGAIADLTQALSFDPEFERARDLLSRAEEKQKALQPVNEKQRLLDSYRAMQRGLKYLKNYQYLKAQEEFKKVLELIPNHENATKRLKQAEKLHQDYLKKQKRTE